MRGFNKDTVEGTVDKKRGEEEVKIANLLSLSTVFVKCASEIRSPIVYSRGIFIFLFEICSQFKVHAGCL